MRFGAVYLVRLALTVACWAMLLSAAPAQESAELKIAAAKLGFSGVYKLGCWTPLEVVLQGGDAAFTGVVEAGTRDADGVATTVSSPPERPVGVRPGEKSIARLFVRVGQDGADLNVRFRDESGRERAARTFATDSESESIRAPLPATDRVIVSFGMGGSLGAVVSSPQSQSSAAPTDHAVVLDDAAGFPVEWFGYEGIDAVVLGAAKPQLYRPLAASPQRIAALARWVESGGQLVMFIGASAPELIGPDGPLASLVPGEFDALAVLRESSPLEQFSGSDEPINRGRPLELQAARLKATQGRILAHAGAGPEDLPLVVRARRGLGEVTFVAVDPDAGPMADWPGRVGLLRQALRWPTPSTTSDDRAYGYGDSAGSDMVNQLIGAMDRQFVGIQTAPFALVALMVIGYILLIGPGDYFFVKRVLKRMELTWITFPLIVLGVSAAAYWLAQAMKGSQLRVNQVEIVDVDLAAGEAHGTVWTHFFSPRVDSYDLRLSPSFAEQPLTEPGHPDPGAHELVAWLGMPGYGIGGMSGHADQTSLFDNGYAFAPALDAMLGLPVQEWSTKSLTARWRADVEAPLEAQLTVQPNELLAGSVANRTGVALHDCVLIHGNWAFLLDDLDAGEEAFIDESQPAIKAATAIATRVGGAFNPNAGAETDRLTAHSDDVGLIVRTMMFYQTLGGDRFAPAPNRYQSFIDLSRLLAGNQAILLARVEATGSQWISGNEPLASDQDRRWVYYRFVIPLEDQE